MKSPIVRLGVVPAIVVLPLTLARAWLEVNHPDSPAMKFLSVLALAGLWILITAVALLRRGASFGTFVASIVTFTLLYRATISVIYAIAWAHKWTTPTGQPTRYVLQVTEQMKMPADVSPGVVFAGSLGFASALHIVVGIVLWFLVWAIAFRNRSPMKAAASA